jgi:hypothetical protein
MKLQINLRSNIVHNPVEKYMYIVDNFITVDQVDNRRVTITIISTIKNKMNKRFKALLSSIHNTYY